jgi:TP901 family phage tail tape measure protein
MSSRSRRLEVIVAGDSSRLDKMVGQSEGRLGKLGRAAARAGAALAAGIAAGAIASVVSFANFDQAMTQSLSIMGDVSQEMRTELSDTAREIAKTTKFSATEAAESYYFLASAGMDAEQSMAALPQVAAFAQAGLFDMARATDLATDAQSALGLSSDDAAENLANLTRVTDVFVGASTLANTSVEQIADAMTNKAGAALRSANKEIEEGAAVLAAFADGGLKGAAAGEQLSILLRDLPRAAANNADEFKKFGIEVLDSDGNLRNMADVVAEFENGLGGMSDAQRATALEQMGLTKAVGNGVVALMGSSGAIAGYQSELENMGGITQDVAEGQLDTFWAQLGLLKDNILDVAIGVGEQLTPHLMTLVGVVADQMPAIQAFIEGGLERLATVMNDIVIPAVAWVIAAVGDLKAGFNDGLDTTPIQRLGAIAATVFAAVSAFVTGQLIPAVEWLGRATESTVRWIADNWESIRPIVIGIGALILTLLIPHWIALGVQATIAAAKNVAAWVSQSTAGLRHGASILASIARVVAGWVMMAGRAAVSAAGVVKTLVMLAGHYVAQGARMVASMAATAARTVASWVMMGAQSLAQAARMAAAWVIAMGPVGWVIVAVVALVALIIANWDKVRDFTVRAWNAVTSFVSNAWSNITTAVRSGVDRAVEWVRALPGRLLDGIRTLGTTVLRFIVDNHPAAILLRKAREMWPDVSSWFRELPGRIISAIGNIGVRMANIGRDVVRGLWDGITGMAGWLTDKVSGFVSRAIPGPIKSALGISSPSKVAAELAREVPRGMAVGLEAELGTLQAMAEQVANAALIDLEVPTFETGDDTFGEGSAGGTFAGDSAADGLRDVTDRIADLEDVLEQKLDRLIEAAERGTVLTADGRRIADVVDRELASR